MNYLEEFEDIRAICEMCRNPLYVRKKDRKIVCSTKRMLGNGFIPLSKRCYEPISNVVEES